MIEKEIEYKWRLTWCGMQDSPMLRAAVEHCMEFPLFKDSKAQIVGHEEYIALVEAKQIAPPESYWQVKEGKVGLISLEYYIRYSKTWENISSCKSDFEAGWLACEKHRKERV